MRAPTTLLPPLLISLTTAQLYPNTTTTPPPSASPTPWNVTHYGGTISLTNNLSSTPPMGWSTWNNFGPMINETLIKRTMHFLETSGLHAAGYIYLSLDDGWQHHKGPRSLYPLEPDPSKFPSGMKALADYAHERGFKLGIYSGPGEETCAGYTGSAGHEREDARMFAEWGIDHLKYDACCSHGDAPQAEVMDVMLDMSLALLSTNASIVYHACHCGWSQIWEWALEIGANHWRIGQDISDDFNYPGNREKYYFDVLDMLDRGNEVAGFSKPGGWNDYDMLIVGLDGESGQLVGGGASDVEYRTHFSLWCLVNSPLFIGADVEKLDAYDLETLTNGEMIAVNQDAKGEQVTLQWSSEDGELQIYARTLADESLAVALLNRGSETAYITVDMRRDLTVPWDVYRLRDLWKHRDLGPYDIPFTAEVRSHEAKVYRVWKVECRVGC